MAAADGCGAGPVWQGKLSWVLRSLLVVGHHARGRFMVRLCLSVSHPLMMVSLSIPRCEGVTLSVVRRFSGEIVPCLAVRLACPWGRGELSIFLRRLLEPEPPLLYFRCPGNSRSCARLSSGIQDLLIGRESCGALASMAVGVPPVFQHKSWLHSRRIQELGALVGVEVARRAV